MLNIPTTRLRRVLGALALLSPVAASAATTGSYTADYTGYSHGFTVLKLSGTLTLTPDGYAAHVTFHAAGFAGMMVRMDNDSQVTGHFAGSEAQPALFEGTGHLHGTNRVTRITYTNGNPTIQALSPPVEQERTSVAPADTLHTIDTLSAVSLLIREVGQSGRCDGSVSTFDGRRLATQTVHTSGQEVLPKTGRSIFAGSALRCDFDGRQLGGFIKDENEDNLRKPRHGTAWLADMLPGAPPVPVRVAFENKLLGQVTLYLTALTPDGAKTAGAIP